MAIITTRRETKEIVRTSYAGRVLKVKRVNETRNTSDTLDYSDYRTVESTYALVWLGTYNVPAYSRGEEVDGLSAPLREDREGNTWNPARALEFNEQFAWVDCTTLCPWRDQDDHIAEVDAVMGHGDPMMWANFIAWEAYQKALVAKAAKAAEEARKAKEAAAAKKQKQAEAKAAKEAAAENAAKAMLAHIPAKGTTVTVDGFTGKIFWTGATKYYGKWNARAGVKNAAGEVRWVDASHWAK